MILKIINGHTFSAFDDQTSEREPISCMPSTFPKYPRQAFVSAKCAIPNTHFPLCFTADQRTLCSDFIMKCRFPVSKGLMG